MTTNERLHPVYSAGAVSLIVACDVGQIWNLPVLNAIRAGCKPAPRQSTAACRDLLFGLTSRPAREVCRLLRMRFDSREGIGRPVTIERSR